MPQEQFRVKVGEQMGPLDLILELVQQRKMLVSDVSLAEIADSFIAHLDHAEGIALEEIAQFLVVAATLLLIKSRSLLPNLPISKDEEANIEDLEARLNIYKQIKERATILKNLFSWDHVRFASPIQRAAAFRVPRNREDLTNEISVKNLFSVMRNLLSNIPKVEKLSSTAIEKVVSVEEMMTSIVDRLEQAINVTFSNLHGRSGVVNKKEKIHVIVSFLALLELARRGTVALKQSSHFDEIEIESQKLGVPQYA